MKGMQFPETDLTAPAGDSSLRYENYIPLVSQWKDKLDLPLEVPKLGNGHYM